MKKLKLFDGKNTLIIGGLGFIGSNLAHGLVKLNSRVLIVDNLSPLNGGNIFNINGIEDKCKILIRDIKDQSLIDTLVKKQDFIFNLAGQRSHVGSMENPLYDLEVNCEQHLVLLEACKRFNPKVKILFTGSRMQYGKVTHLPVNENYPMKPIDISGINKMTAEAYYLLYHKQYGLKTASLRLTNTYGPRHQMLCSKTGVLNWFVRKSLDDEEIEIFGNGSQERDFNYVDDVVAALLLTAASNKTYGEVFNLGSGKPISIIDLAKLIINISGLGKIKHITFPNNYKSIETGDFSVDCAKIRKILGWKPDISLEEGLKNTIDYYKHNKNHYW